MKYTKILEGSHYGFLECRIVRNGGEGGIAIRGSNRYMEAPIGVVEIHFNLKSRPCKGVPPCTATGCPSKNRSVHFFFRSSSRFF